MTVKTVAIVGGAAVGAYLIYDHMRASDQPGPSGQSLVSNAVNAVTCRSSALPNSVPAAKVGMPQVTGGTTMVDASSTSYNNMTGIAILCNEILCGNTGNGGDVAAAFASCEMQTGSLRNACWNCSLFNVHWYGSAGYPPTRVGCENLISFRTGAATDVEGFRRCITHFKGFLERRSPDALAAIRARNFDNFQVAISRIGYAPSYTNSVSGNTIRNRFIEARYNRLVSAGLLPRRS